MTDGRHLGVIGTKPKPDFDILSPYAKFELSTCLHGSKMPFLERNFVAARGREGKKNDIL